MLAQVSLNLSSVSLVVSIMALLVALFSLPASILQYVTWIRDAALWVALAFVVALALKVGYQRSYGQGKPVTQALLEFLGQRGDTPRESDSQKTNIDSARSLADSKS